MLYQISSKLNNVNMFQWVYPLVPPLNLLLRGSQWPPDPQLHFIFPNNGKRRFFWVTPFLANTHQADDEINKERAMAKYLINIAKSQYYLDNNLNWNAAQCNLQNH